MSRPHYLVSLLPPLLVSECLPEEDPGVDPVGFTLLEYPEDKMGVLCYTYTHAGSFRILLSSPQGLVLRQYRFVEMARLQPPDSTVLPPADSPPSVIVVSLRERIE